MESQRLQEAQLLLACEIASGDAEAVAPGVRTAIERGWVQHQATAARNFNRILLDQRASKEREIRGLCERYYGEFLGCIQQLLQMRGAAQRLKQATVEIHEDLAEHSGKAIHVIENLHRQQRRRANVEAAQAVISDCRELALLMVKAQQQIRDNDTYNALETVEQLQAQDIPSQGMYSHIPKPFLKHLQKWLPAITDQLIQNAKEELSLWFTEVRDQMLSIGTAAIHRSCLQLATVVGTAPRAGLSSLVTRLQANHVRHAIHPLHVERWAAAVDLEAMLPRGIIEAGQQSGMADFLSELDNMADSFGPVHRSVYAYARLGRLQELQRFYTDVRSVQAQVGSMISLDLHKVLSEKQFEAAVYTLACKTSGFFLTECILRQTVEQPEGVMGWTELQELWERCSSDIGEFVTRNMSNLTTSTNANAPLVAIRVKETLLALHSLISDDVVALRGSNVVDLITTNYENFKRILTQSIQGSCRAIIENSQSQPLQIVTPEQFQSTIAAFRLERVQAGQEQSDILDRMQTIGGRKEEILLPHTFPFSEAVPKTIHLFHRLAMHFVVYTSQLTLRTQGADLLQLLNVAVQQMSDCIADAAKGMDEGTPLSRISQLSIDAMCLGQACKQLKVMLDEVFAFHSWTDVSPKELDRAMENAQRTFDAASVRARDLIFEHITAKIEDLLSSMCFAPAEPSAPCTQPHAYCDDVIGYLQVTFMCLTHLPLAVREGVHFASCARVANGILSFLTDSEDNGGVKKINVYALLGFRKDVAALQQFADSCGVSHLSQCFLELSQLLDAAFDNHMTQMALANDVAAIKSHYPTLNTSKLALLVEKIVPVSMFARSHAQSFTSGTALLTLDRKTAHKIANKLRDFDG